MGPDLLEKRLATAFLELSPAERGAQLREEYEACVQTYWDIAEAAGARTSGNDASRRTPLINLGTYTHPQVGVAQCSASVKIQPRISQPAGRGEIQVPYFVEVHFYGSTRDGREKYLAGERFGGNTSDFIAMRPPAWIRNPKCTADAPWGEEGMLFPGDITAEYPWDDENFADVYMQLWPMIQTARATQAMLVAAMRDEKLNPKIHERAKLIRLPGEAP